MTNYPGNPNHPNTIRLQDYNYTNPGAYFITVCTNGHRLLFGVVVDGRMRLNGAGRAVQMVWEELPNRYPGVDIDTFVVMPNHIHGIIHITGAIRELPLRDKPQSGMLQHEPPLIVRRRRMLLPKVVGFFKMNAAKRINRMRQSQGATVWQQDYYEHVIRKTDDMARIREYILNNPLRWEFDRENPLT